MITAVIIDDEKNNITNLEGLLKRHCPGVEIKGSAQNAKDGQALITTLQPDLVFLDIQMPDQNGFDLLRSLPSHEFEVVFVTAYDQYGIQAVKFSAIDYLLKPVNAEELKAAVDKAIHKMQGRRQNLLLNNLMQYMQHVDSKINHKLALSTLKETRFVNPGQIVRCESSNAYTIFYLSDQQKLTISRPIYEYEELLTGYGFIRCHQSHLVNRSYIKSWIKEDGGYLLLDDGTTIPISRSKKETVISVLSNIK